MRVYKLTKKEQRAVLDLFHDQSVEIIKHGEKVEQGHWILKADILEQIFERYSTHREFLDHVNGED